VSVTSRSCCIALALLAWASVAAAQTNRAPAGPSRFTVSAGLIVNGGYDVGDRNAELRGNSGNNSTPFILFRADGALERVAGLEARFGFALTRALSIEVGGTVTKPELRVTVTSDPEVSGTTLVGETVSQYTVDVGAIVKLPWPRRASGVRPYAMGGAGYLRQLHEDQLLVETGHTIFGGGGVEYALRAPGGRHPLGVRAEARLARRFGGIDFEDKTRSHPSLSVLGFLGF
jgi:hypothetical protein